MFYQTTVPDDAGGPSLPDLDAVAANYYRANQAAMAYYAAWQGGTTVVYRPKLWLISVQAQKTGQNVEWAVYAFTSRDQPGWPLKLHDAIPTPDAQTIAAGLAGGGHTVYLRRYEDFEIAHVATTVPVTPA